MKPERFDIGIAIQFGWDTMKTNIGYFILVVLVFWLAEGIPSAFTSIFPRNAPVVAIFSLVSLVVGVFIAMASIKIGLSFCDGKEADYSNLYSAYPVFWRFLGANILYGLLVLAGLILLIVPGIYWALKYQFVPYLVIDKDTGIMDAFRKSGEMTYGEKWHLLLLGLAILGIYILGFLACVIGLFVAIPIIMVAIAYVYRRLLMTAEEVEREQPEPPRPVASPQETATTPTPSAEEPPSESPPEQPQG